jgi:hypothetical protein
MSRDIRNALAIVWGAVTLAGMLLIAAPAVVPERTLAGWVPACEAKARGGACVTCGMTTAFYAISRGQFGPAAEANRGAVPLYAALALNTVLFCGWSARLWGAGRARWAAVIRAEKGE